MHSCRHAERHACIHSRTHARTHAGMHTRTHTFTHAHMHICRYAHTCIPAYILSTHACWHARTHTYAYMHTCIPGARNAATLVCGMQQPLVCGIQQRSFAPACKRALMHSAHLSDRPGCMLRSLQSPADVQPILAGVHAEKAPVLLLPTSCPRGLCMLSTSCVLRHCSLRVTQRVVGQHTASLHASSADRGCRAR